VGSDDWTTLVDANGNTSTDVGQSCLTTGDGSAWQTIHPFLAHYQTVSATGDSCTSTGSSGSWNAATGSSGGWQHWQMAIPDAYKGKDVEIAISVASDPASLGLGAWVDQVQLLDSADAPINSADPSFEAGHDGGTHPGPPGPAGPAPPNPATGGVRAQSAPFVETPIVTTTDTVYTGFGLEAVTGAAKQGDLMKAAFAHLGTPVKPTFDAPAPTIDGAGNSGTQPNPGTGPAIPGNPKVPPKKRLTGLKLGSRSLAAALSRGIAVGTRCTDGCSVALKLTVDRKTQRRYRLPGRTLGTATVRLTKSGTKTTRIRLRSGFKPRLKKAKSLLVTVAATQAGVKPAVKKSAKLPLKR
jgi:hypothetical protein